MFGMTGVVPGINGLKAFNRVNMTNSFKFPNEASLCFPVQWFTVEFPTLFNERKALLNMLFQCGVCDAKTKQDKS